MAPRSRERKSQSEIAYNKFQTRLGKCITQWAIVDRQLFDMFEFLLGIEKRKVAVIFYAFQTLGQRVRITREIFECSMNDLKPKPPKKPAAGIRRTAGRGAAIFKELDSLTPVRNEMAHNPVTLTPVVIKITLSKSLKPLKYRKIGKPRPQLVFDTNAILAKPNKANIVRTYDDLRKHWREVWRLSGKIIRLHSELESLLNTARRTSSTMGSPDMHSKK